MSEKIGQDQKIKDNCLSSHFYSIKAAESLINVIRMGSLRDPNRSHFTYTYIALFVDEGW